MTWASIILAILKLVEAIFTAAQENKWIDVGKDAEIAKTSASILSKTEYAKNVREKIAGLDDVAVDKLLRDLEPK